VLCAAPALLGVYGTIGNAIEKFTEPELSVLPAFRTHTPSLKFGLTFCHVGVNVSVLEPQSRARTHDTPLNIHHLN
jgi:hypothetical protein